MDVALLSLIVIVSTKQLFCICLVVYCCEVLVISVVYSLVSKSESCFKQKLVCPHYQPNWPENHTPKDPHMPIGSFEGVPCPFPPEISILHQYPPEGFIQCFIVKTLWRQSHNNSVRIFTWNPSEVTQSILLQQQQRSQPSLLHQSSGSCQ